MKRLLCIASGLAGSLLLPGFVGCMQPAGGPVAALPSQERRPVPEPAAESNIVKVNKFFSSEPWLSFSGDGSSRIDGLRFAVYLESAARYKGVFGSGTIVVTLYRLDRDAAGQEQATQVQEWVLPRDKAYPWRARHETALGWGYGLRLPWDQDLDLAGRQIAVVVRYIRDDGRVITSSRKVLKVPASGDSALAAPSPTPAKRALRPAARRPAVADVAASDPPP
jgi:hypothetical protein